MRIFFLVLLSVVFRWPVLSHAKSLHSDAAIVGLQTRHMLAGEWAPFLHGSGYQSSTDAILALPWFALFGSEPWVLLSSTLALHIAFTLCVDAVLRNAGLSRWRSFLLCLALVFTPPPIHTYALYPPRQAAITIAGFAMLAAAKSRGPRMIALSCVLAGAAVYADPYAQVFVPAVFVLLASRATTRSWSGLAAAASGSLVGACLPYWLRHRADASNGPMGFGFEPWRIERAAKLLRTECGPWITSAKAYVPAVFEGHQPWPAPSWFGFVQTLGATTLVIGALSAGVLLFVRSVKWPLRAAGVAGLAVWGLTTAAFFVSVMVMDLYSTRYLAALVLTAPLALAPLAAWMQSRTALLPWGAYLSAAAVAGWLGFAPLVSGFSLTEHPSGRGVDEDALLKACKEHQVRAVMTDYWAAYRLAFLWKEQVVAMPPTAHEDRYARYREVYARAEHVAYVYDPARSREKPGEAAALAAAQGVVSSSSQIGSFTVWWIDKPVGKVAVEKVDAITR